MCKIKIPNRFIVDLNKLSIEQKRQYLMIRSWSKRRAKRYAYLVTHPKYRGLQVLKSPNQYWSSITAGGY